MGPKQMVQILKMYLPNGTVLSWGRRGIPCSKWPSQKKKKKGKSATEIHPLIQKIIFESPDLF